MSNTFYFRPLQVYKYIMESNPELLREALGDKMFFNLIYRDSYSRINDGEEYYKDENGIVYKLGYNGLMGFLKGIWDYASTSKDTVDILEKVEYLNPEDECFFMGVRGSEYLISKQFKDKFLEAPKDYRNIEHGRMMIPGALEDKNALSLRDDETILEVEDNRTAKEQEIVSIEEQMKKTMEELKKAQELEMQKIKEEFALKMSKAKLEIAKKITPLVKDLENMTDKLAVLENNLYRWMSYTGENYNLKQLCMGDSADSREKFVIWQKVRYLDEELPKLVLDSDVESDVNFAEFRSLENIMASYGSVRDFFIPSEKGCIVFQLSRQRQKTYSFKKIEVDKNDPHHPWIEYVKASYNVENWNKLGMFVKNGSNLYVLWLDSDYINIASDNVFLSRNSTETIDTNYSEPIQPSNNEKDMGEIAMRNIEIMKDNFSKRRRAYSKFNARVYLLDILQGLIDNFPQVLELGEGQDISKALAKGSYGNVVFNNADGYITQKKWNNYKDILNEISAEYSYGDPIYVLKYDSGRDRGRVNASYQMQNFTNDAVMEVGLNKINLIDYHDTYFWTKEITEDMLEWNDSRREYVLKRAYSHLTIITQHLENGKVVDTNFIKYPKSIESFLTDNLGDAPLVAYRLDVYKETKRKEEPLVSRTKLIQITRDRNDGVLGIKESWMYSWIDSFYNPKRYNYPCTSLEEVQKKYPGLHKGEDGKYYYPHETNPVYDMVMSDHNLKGLIEEGFTEDVSRRTREEHLYISCRKSWSSGGGRANVMIYDDEFVPLKKLTVEHVNYMISNSMSLPGFGSYANSVKHLLEIRKYLLGKEK